MSARVAAIEDAAAIAALDLRARPDGWDEPAWRAELGVASSRTWLIERGGALRAYLCAREAAGEAEIVAIAVDPKRRAERVATELLAWWLDRSASSAITLEVREANRAARALYERAGFEAVGRRRAYYADGEDAIVMRRAASGEDARRG